MLTVSAGEHDIRFCIRSDRLITEPTLAIYRLLKRENAGTSILLSQISNGSQGASRS